MLQCYLIDKGPHAGDPLPACDLAEVKKVVRLIPRDGRDDVRVKLVTFECNKRVIVALWRGEKPAEVEVLRKWRLGSRGGKLIEISITED